MEGLPSSRPRAKPNTNLVKEKTERVRAELVNSVSPMMVKCLSLEKSFLLRFLLKSNAWEHLEIMEKDEDGY